MRYPARVLVALGTITLFPALGFAQEVTGTVGDASGGVLPGVSVEAASSALIEKVRTTVTDGTGQYRFTDLYNLFNANTGTAFNQGFGIDGATWLRPTTIMNPRFARFNVTVDF
jgi:carboxypeptidase family protein